MSQNKLAILFLSLTHIKPFQMAKFVGRLTLLDHGLLTASLELVKFAPHHTPIPGAKRAASLGDGDDDAEDRPEESEADYIERIEDYVKDAITQAGGLAVSRDSYKDGLVYDERRKVISEFGKKGYKKCNRCKA